MQRPIFGQQMYQLLDTDAFVLIFLHIAFDHPPGGRADGFALQVLLVAKVQHDTQTDHKAQEHCEVSDEEEKQKSVWISGVTKRKHFIGEEI